MQLPEQLMNGRVAVVSFQGWNDAGDSASQAVALLKNSSEFEHSFRIDDEEYFDYQFIRPVIKFGGTGERSIHWPSIDFSFMAQDMVTGLELLIVEGVEPSRSWRTFARDFEEVLKNYGVSAVIFVGALLADVPHTRPTPVRLSSENPLVQEQMNISPSNYEGPVGILSVLNEVTHQLGVPSIQIWASVPHYAHTAPVPQAILALATKLEEILGVIIDNVPTPEAAQLWVDSVSQQIAADPESSAYLDQLEKVFDTEESYQATGDALAEEFEKFLRDNDEDDDGPAEDPVGPEDDSGSDDNK